MKSQMAKKWPRTRGAGPADSTSNSRSDVVLGQKAGKDKGPRGEDVGEGLIGGASPSLYTEEVKICAYGHQVHLGNPRAAPTPSPANVDCAVTAGDRRHLPRMQPPLSGYGQTPTGCESMPRAPGHCSPASPRPGVIRSIAEVSLCSKIVLILRKLPPVKLDPTSRSWLQLVHITEKTPPSG